MMHARLFVIVVAALGLLVPVARADDAFRLDVPPPPPPPPAKPFAKGTKTIQAEAGYTVPISSSVEEFATGTVGVGYYLWDDHCFTLLAHGFHVNQAFDEDADGGGVSVMGRWHFYNADPFSFYLDGGGGLTWANVAVPLGGTTYNYTARAGVGVAYRLADDVYLTGGARYFHLSNAQQHGREKNPNYNGIECYVGLLFTFR